MKISSTAIIAALAFLPACIPGRAVAEGQNELGISVGLRSNYRGQPLQYGFIDWLSQSGEPYKLDDIKDAGAYFISFHRPLSPAFSLGIAAGIEQEQGTFSDEGAQHSGDYRKRSLTVAMEARYAYYDRGKLRMYASAGLGFRAYKQQTAFWGNFNGVNNMLESSEQLSGGPAYHLNAFGIRYGGKAGAFAEIGYGYKGMLNLGVSARF